MSARASPEGTAHYAALFPTPAAAGHFKPGMDGLSLSSIGLGTYLGDPAPQVDEAYRAAAVLALKHGCNVIDSAINYRFQRSERAIGSALAEAFAAGEASREAVFISTKGGYVPFDGGWPDDPEAWIAETFVRRGIAQPEDFVESHCMTPAYLAHQIGQSRANLGLETIDLYYLHNPEGQRPVVGPQEFTRRLRLAFQALEEAVVRGEIAVYGAATWSGYRQPPGAADHLELEDMVALARDLAGDGHHFRAIQLPHNLGLPEAFSSRTQTVSGEALSTLEAAARLGVTVFASASLLQGRLARGLADALRPHFPGCETDAQRALQFVRSTPGLTTALVGMSHSEHVLQNLALAELPPLDATGFRALFR